MSRKWELDKAALDELLAWLDPDPKEAAQKYETIRAGLVRMLIYRKCSAAEDLTDQIINRVAKKLPTIRDVYKGDPASYFYGVARNVFLEHQRSIRNVQPFDDQLHNILDSEPTDEASFECMKRCMKKLKPTERELVYCYFEEAKFGQREMLAKSLGTTRNALAVRVFRIRASLKKCFFKCMQENRVK